MSTLPCFSVPLFVPANRPERFARAAASGADAIILDLEDAVAADEKGAARDALKADFTTLPVLVRINAVGTLWHRPDLDAVSNMPVAGIVVPKVESVDELALIARTRPVIALIESVRGLAEARAIAASGHVERLAFGSVDYSADLGCEHVREALAHARAEIVFASKLAGLAAPLDGVTTAIEDDRLTIADARHAMALGFNGKMVIHPRQVAAVRKGSHPHDDEIAWARRVVQSGEGVAKVDATMIDAPMRLRAHWILARAGIGSG